jgi:branched-subunit amino acid aminotransferase/4-amino-4-deoxychorismate lyase
MYFSLDKDNEIVKAPDLIDQDGFFETMYFNGTRFPLKSYHLERVAKSLFRKNTLPVDIISPIEKRLQSLNNTLRVRVDYYVINKEVKVELRFCKYAPKADRFSVDFLQIESLNNEYNLKKQHRSTYHKAFEWAKENHLNEVILTDKNDELLEGSFTNIFLLKDDRIYTPPLSIGIVGGCFRRLLTGQPFVKVKTLTKKDYINADEIFLTNALRGITPVKTSEDSVVMQLLDKFSLDKI